MAASLALAIPIEAPEGEAVFVRIEVWRLADRLQPPEIDYLRLPPRFGWPDRITEAEFREATGAAR